MLKPAPPCDRDVKAVAAIGRLLTERTGQELAPNRAWRIESALQPIMRARGLTDLTALNAALEARSGGSALSDTVVDALLNQETSFYRDIGVIDLAADILDDRRGGAAGRRPRLWSAGCSVGQEPYSLAMLVAERAEQASGQVEIIATDVSQAALNRARAGRYSQFEIQRGLPVRRMLRWFEQDGDEWIARPELVRMVSFRRHNLTLDPIGFAPFDVVLCRNVLMYFTIALRRAVFDRLADAMRPDGLLILGAGETTIGQTDRFVPSRRFRGAYALAGTEN